MAARPSRNAAACQTKWLYTRTGSLTVYTTSATTTNPMPTARGSQGALHASGAVSAGGLGGRPCATLRSTSTLVQESQLLPVTDPATGVPDRGTGAETRTSGTRHPASAILIVLALGLAFRLIIAQQLPGSGFDVDLTSFRAWAANLAAQGPFGFYDRPFFHDYTPGYLYVLWIVGIVGHLLEPIGRVVALPSVLGEDLIKLPPILADLALGWLVWSMSQELGGSRRAGLIGAALGVVNPITWFDSVVWGQVDAVGTVFLLLGMRELWRDRPERSAIFTVIAAVIKPQLGILVPIVAAVVIRRALLPRGGYGDEPPPADGGPAHVPMFDIERRTRSTRSSADGFFVLRRWA